MNILFKSEPLGGRKPPQMLTNFSAYCSSAWMEPSVMFQYMFLVTSEAWQPERTSFGPLTSSSPMTVEVANMDMAEEQPVAQIAAVHKKEPRKM
jgi:hypothetical protein